MENVDYWLEDIETLSQMNVTSLTIEMNQWISNSMQGCLISYSSFTASYSSHNKLSHLNERLDEGWDNGV